MVADTHARGAKRPTLVACNQLLAALAQLVFPEKFRKLLRPNNASPRSTARHASRK
jgi:hypothetical protein